MWFKPLFGFAEGEYAQTQSRFAVEGSRLRSLVNGAHFGIGTFETPSLAALRTRAAALPHRGALRMEHVAVTDVLALHALPENQGALFQVASQFNCLEFPGPSTVPEDGVTGYEGDPTQGPACALAAAPATVYRNYLAPVGTQVGQTRARQIDNLTELAQALGPGDPGWDMRNGYTFSSVDRLRALTARLMIRDREALLGHVRIGVQSNVEVVFRSRFERATGSPHVSQAFCSALSCAYSGVPNAAWEPLATLVLDAAYEATLLAAALDRAAGLGSGRVWLTFLGGGAFGNDDAWIAGAIGRALARVGYLDLDVRIAHFRRIRPGLGELVDAARRTHRPVAAGS